MPDDQGLRMHSYCAQAPDRQHVDVRVDHVDPVGPRRRFIVRRCTHCGRTLETLDGLVNQGRMQGHLDDQEDP